MRGQKSQSTSVSMCVSGAVASTEVKQKLQEFLLSKSATKDTPTNGKNHSVSRHPKLWYTYVWCLAVFIPRGKEHRFCYLADLGLNPGLAISQLCGCWQVP
jgi:hypothetical protein